MSRSPTKEDFTPEMSTLITIVAPPISSSPSPERPPANILLLFHGFGDTSAPFAGLANAMRLPETLCLAVRGPNPLSLGFPGFQWGDDIVFSGSELDDDTSFTKSQEAIRSIVEDVLVARLGYPRRAIFFFGFGQGGMAALHFASLLPGRNGEDNEYGGVISIGGPLPHSSPSHRVNTPVLLVASERGSRITPEAENRVKNVFSNVKVVRWKGRNRDGMMANREETRDIMEFLARRLRSWAETEGPSGTMEVRESHLCGDASLSRR